MFGWFKKKPDQKPAAREPAYEMGREAAQAMIDDFERFMAARFGNIHENCQHVFRSCLQKSLSRQDAPPMLVARIEFKFFLEEVDELKPKMLAEIDVAMAKWLDVMNDIDTI